MEPLSIAAACISLVGVIGKTTIQVGLFVHDIRESRKELDAISRELSSLSLCRSALANDSASPAAGFPLSLADNVLSVVRNCNEVVHEIDALLAKMSVDSIKRKVQWAAYGRKDATTLWLNLEAHKSALDIALDMITLYVSLRILDIHSFYVLLII